MRYALLLLTLSVMAAEPAIAQTPPPAGPPVVSEWNGYQRIDFTLSGRPCLIVVPKTAAEGRPWIWRTEFFGHQPQVDLALLERGWHVAYMDASNMYGSRPAIALFGDFYAHLVTHAQLARRVVLEGFSRGGLYAMNFAASHPTRVAAMYLDAPVLDIRSWPGRNRASKEWAECLQAHGITEAQVDRYKGNPVMHVPSIARARIPVIVVAGDADQTVPLAENTGVLEKAYREIGAPIEVIVKRGVGHHPHSLEDPTPVVNFLLNNAKW